MLTQLRVGLSALNLHKFRHDLKDAIHSMCLINNGIEDMEHVLLSCPVLCMLSKDMIFSAPSAQYCFQKAYQTLLKVLLFGDWRLSTYSNSQIIKANLEYIHASQLFS